MIQHKCSLPLGEISTVSFKIDIILKKHRTCFSLASNLITVTVCSSTVWYSMYMYMTKSFDMARQGEDYKHDPKTGS